MGSSGVQTRSEQVPERKAQVQPRVDPHLQDPLTEPEEQDQLQDPLVAKPKAPPPKLGGGGPPEGDPPKGKPPTPPPPPSGSSGGPPLPPTPPPPPSSSSGTPEGPPLPTPKEELQTRSEIPGGSGPGGGEPGGSEPRDTGLVVQTKIPELGGSKTGELGGGTPRDSFSVDTDSVKDPGAFLGDHPTFTAFRDGSLDPKARDKVQRILDKTKAKIDSTAVSVDTRLQGEKTLAQNNETGARKTGEDDKARAKTQHDQQKLTAQKTSNQEQGLNQQQGKTQESGARNSTNTQIGSAQGTANQQIQGKEQKLQQDKNATISQAQRQGQALQEDAKAKSGDAGAKAGSPSLWDRAKTLASNTWDSIKSTASGLWEKAKALANDLMTKAQATVARWTAQLQQWVAERKAQLKAQIDQLKAALNSTLERIKQSVAAKWAEISSKLSAKLQEIQKGLSEAWEQVKNKVTETVKSTWEAAKERGRALKEGFVSTVSGIWQEAKDTFDSLTDSSPGLTPEKELFLTPEERADWIFKAVRGLGTDETMLLRCLNGTPSENAKVAAIYKQKYGKDLAEVLKSELSGNDLAQAQELLSTGKVSLGTRIDRAMEGWGADSDSIAAMFEKATPEERLAILNDEKYSALRARLIAEGGPEIFNRLKKGVNEKGELAQTEDAIVARLAHRGAGWGTDEDGSYKDLIEFAKANPGLAKKLASDSGSALYKALASELSGRDLDKALGLLKGGGTRTLQDVLDSEEARLGTDEDGVFKALMEMDPKERDAISKDPKRKAQVLAALRRELGDSDYTKASALLETGKQSGIDKIDEELSGLNTDDRVVLDAVIGMDASERAKLAADSKKLAKLKGGMSSDNYAKMCAILGVGVSKDAGPAEANSRRIAWTIIDGADHIFDANEDQVFKAVLEAQALAKKKPPEANLQQILDIVRKDGRVSPMVPAFQRIYRALEGKEELTSIDRLKQSTAGAGTDDAAMVSMIDDLSGKDLLERWSNIGDYRKIKKELADAQNSKDQKRITEALRRRREFILDVNPSVLSIIRGDTSGKDRTEVLAKLRKKLRDAASTDTEFKEALGDTGLKLNELDLEKMEYLQSNEEMDVHRREGSSYSPNDLFSSKGKQLDDSHGSYMGTLRSGIQSVERGESKVSDVVKQTDAEQSEFEERLQAYKDMKAFAANVVAAVVGTIVAVVTTILTGGGAAGFWAAVLAGAQAGAYSAIASVAVKEVIQGGSYSVLEEGTAEVLLGTVCGAIGGGAKSAFGGSLQLSKLSGQVEGKLGKALAFLGPNASTKIASTAATNIPLLPETLVNNISQSTLNTMVNQEGFFRSGFDGMVETLTPSIIQGVSKDLLANTITQGVLKFTGINQEGLKGGRLQHGMEKTGESLIENSTKLGIDFALSEGRMSEQDIIKGLLSMTSESLVTGTQAYHKASLMLTTLNTKSADQLVGYEGITLELAKKIVAYREQHGQFKQLEQLKQVPDVKAEVAEHVYYQRKKKEQEPPPPPEKKPENNSKEPPPLPVKEKEEQKLLPPPKEKEEQKLLPAPKEKEEQKLLPAPKEKEEQKLLPAPKEDKTTGVKPTPEVSTDQKKGAPLKQKSQDLEELYKHAQVAQEHLTKATKEIASTVGGEPLVPPSVKGRDRALEKINADYGGDNSRITDLARSSIICETPEQVYKALEQIKSRFTVLREKDRFKDPKGGYRDMLLNVEMPNGHIVEVQLHVKAMYEAKEKRGGHELYEKVRTIEANAKTANRPLSSEEQAEVNKLNSQMKSLYDDAYATSLKGPSTKGPPQVDPTKQVPEDQKVKPLPANPKEALALKQANIEWTNEEIRGYYLKVNASVESQNQTWIKEGVSVAERAHRAYETRHNARVTCRAMMKDQVEVEQLRQRDMKKYGNPDGPTFEQLVEGAKSKGLKGDAIYESILDSSQRTDKATNDKFKLKGKDSLSGNPT